MAIDNFIYSTAIELNSTHFSAILEHIDEVNETTYIGYAKKGVQSLEDERFAILRLQKNKVTNITTAMWAGGTVERVFSFDNLEEKEYSFLK